MTNNLRVKGNPRNKSKQMNKPFRCKAGKPCEKEYIDQDKLDIHIRHHHSKSKEG